MWAASKWKTLTAEHRAAYRLGLLVALIGAVMLLLPGREGWHEAGPSNVGHTKTDCNECHTPAAGNFVGQAFYSVMHGVGLSETAAYFIYAPAGNEQCLACHENPDDRHPVADFLEPEFEAAREAMRVQFCVSCHQEHLGVRASVDRRVCQHCHTETEVEDDPVDVPHTKLISDERWETCLGCHDFHGNHERTVPQMMSEVLSEEQIQQYLDGGESPYGHRQLTAIQAMRQNNKTNRAE